jgi:hypothetical protein
MNSIASRPSFIDLKKVVAADVARATFQIVQFSKVLDVSEVAKRVGSVSTLSFVMAKRTLTKCQLTRIYSMRGLQVMVTYVFVHASLRNRASACGQVWAIK